MDAIHNLLQTALSGVQQEEIIKQNYNKFDIEPQNIIQLLRSCYEAEVFSRGCSEMKSMSELDTIAKWLHISIRKPWLIIYGTVGNGKTTTAKAVVRLYKTLKTTASTQLKRGNYELAQISQDCYARYLEMSYRCVPTVISAQEITALAANNKEAYDKLKKIPILVIDDIGIEPLRVVNYGTESSPIVDMLYYRYDFQLMTIMTTNKDYTQLCETYGERIEERFKELASKIGYTSKSYR